MLHNVNIETHIFIQVTQGGQYLEILPSLVVLCEAKPLTLKRPSPGEGMDITFMLT